MITTDVLLIELFQQGIEKLSGNVPNRDKKILMSLARQIISGNFLTENQSNLLVKILKENIQHLSTVDANKLASIEFPTWSKQFRIIDQVRKIYINKDAEKLLIEFTYSKKLRQLIGDLNKQIEGQMASVGSKQYTVPLTEKNIFNVVNAFKSYGFSIDETVMRFYNDISNFLNTDKNQFDVFSLTNEKLLTAIKADVKDISDKNLLLLNDRRLKFQYSIYAKDSEVSLKNSLAYRPNTRVWLDSKTTTLNDLISALKDLDRLPLLVVFNGHESKECLQNLKKLSTALSNNNINSNIGIYFRFDNVNDSNKDFNNTVSQIGYNSVLSENTLIAGIANNKLPKFLLKSGWYPKSVITFSNSFKNNKTSIYCDAVDLIVYYNEKQPLGGADAIV
jgi:hypothetical protein